MPSKLYNPVVTDWQKGDGQTPCVSTARGFANLPVAQISYSLDDCAKKVIITAGKESLGLSCRFVKVKVNIQLACCQSLWPVMTGSNQRPLLQLPVLMRVAIP